MPTPEVLVQSFRKVQRVYPTSYGSRLTLYLPAILYSLLRDYVYIACDESGVRIYFSREDCKKRGDACLELKPYTKSRSKNREYYAVDIPAVCWQRANIDPDSMVELVFSDGVLYVKPLPRSDVSA